jgi:hypothetical protein
LVSDSSVHQISGKISGDLRGNVFWPQSISPFVECVFEEVASSFIGFIFSDVFGFIFSSGSNVISRSGSGRTLTSWSSP